MRKLVQGTVSEVRAHCPMFYVPIWLCSGYPVVLSLWRWIQLNWKFMESLPRGFTGKIVLNFQYSPELPVTTLSTSIQEHTFMHRVVQTFKIWMVRSGPYMDKTRLFAGSLWPPLNALWPPLKAFWPLPERSGRCQRSLAAAKSLWPLPKVSGRYQNLWPLPKAHWSLPKASRRCQKLTGRSQRPLVAAKSSLVAAKGLSPPLPKVFGRRRGFST